LAIRLWFNASENLQRIRGAGVEDGVFPIHADARSLPFATDDLYLSYLARFVKPGGAVGIAGAGLTRDTDGPIPALATFESWAAASPGRNCRSRSCPCRRST